MSTVPSAATGASTATCVPMTPPAAPSRRAESTLPRLVERTPSQPKVKCATFGPISLIFTMRLSSHIHLVFRLKESSDRGSRYHLVAMLPCCCCYMLSTIQVNSVLLPHIVHLPCSTVTVVHFPPAFFPFPPSLPPVSPQPGILLWVPALCPWPRPGPGPGIANERHHVRPYWA